MNNKYYTYAICIIAAIALIAQPSRAELPASLPGEEITQEYMRWAVPRDTVSDSLHSTSAAPAKAPGTWLDKAAKTWSAPSMAEQLAADPANIPIGKGGIFVPRFTQSPSEPHIEIIDPDGNPVASGEPGISYSVEPGTYYVMLGSGSHRQRIVRTVSVQEGKSSPILPDWSGLQIETVDENATPFRGEYELVRIDEFEPFGREFGANPDIGESVKPWVLKPGTYKILGRGEGYNTLTNFVTVRLLPGELVRFLLVQRPEDLKIVGGGTIEVNPGTKITSRWKYGGDIGGSIKFNADINRRASNQSNIYNTVFNLLSRVWLTYNNKPFEWETRVRLDEGFSFLNFELANLLSDADDFYTSSTFIWRFLPWLGPYGRAELRTNFLPRRAILDQGKNEFILLPANFTGDTSALVFDSSRTMETDPSFSPLTIDFGLGANVDILTNNVFEARLLGGIGSSYSRFPDRYLPISADKVVLNEPDSSLSQRLARSLAMQQQNETNIFEIGPQALFTGTLRLGRMAMVRGELKVFAPVVPETRFTRPDFDLTTSISWRLARAITLDYDYTYQLKQPADIDAQVDRSTHRIWLRFNYASR